MIWTIILFFNFFYFPSYSCHYSTRKTIQMQDFYTSDKWDHSFFNDILKYIYSCLLIFYNYFFNNLYFLFLKNELKQYICFKMISSTFYPFLFLYHFLFFNKIRNNFPLKFYIMVSQLFAIYDSITFMMISMLKIRLCIIPHTAT